MGREIDKVRRAINNYLAPYLDRIIKIIGRPLDGWTKSITRGNLCFHCFSVFDVFFYYWRQQMGKKIISIILICGMLFQLSCATTKQVPVARSDYHELQDEKKLFVTMKNNQVFELVDFKISDTQIVGTAIYERGMSDKEKKKVEINLEDVEFIQVAVTDSARVVQGFFTFLGVLVVIVGLACIIASK